VQPAVFPTVPFPDHALLDSGDGAKLERFGDVVVARPDPQALWKPRLAAATWKAADLVFERDPGSGGRAGRWVGEGERRLREGWEVGFGRARLVLRPTPFKHVGLFPEQAPNWAFAAGALARCGERPRLLNLFGYTGAASVLAALEGAEVTHVDASRTVLSWTQENARRSGLAPDAPRVVLDDALAFARREARRGRRYHGILLDPPHHGRGPKGETWRFETDLAPLVEACGALLEERAFLVLSSYAIGYSPLAVVNLLEGLEGGTVAAGELVLDEEGGGRRLPCGFCARWSRALA
jgi:23S rRNA (cytosine1962-C5)-methyltransferase